jgi:hypothetical protein
MTDTELTEIVAKWCGIEYFVEDDDVFFQGVKKPNGKIFYKHFNPLTDKNDLWDIVIPKLRNEITICANRYRIGGSYYGMDLKHGPLPDLNRAVVTLVAEIVKEAV